MIQIYMRGIVKNKPFFNLKGLWEALSQKSHILNWKLISKAGYGDACL